MKIEVWSDFACPFCYVGKRNLETALAEFAGRNDVEVVYRAFELDPHASGEVETTTQQRIEQKYRKSPAEALEFIRYVEQAAAKVGLDMRYESVQYTRTFDAHRLAKFAETKGLGKEMTERLFKAYFTDNIALAKRINLIDLALEVGLEREDVAQLLTGDDFGHDVRGDERDAHQLGVTGVPFFVIDEQYGLSGAQPPEMLLQAMQQATQKQANDEIITGASCGIDGCN